MTLHHRKSIAALRKNPAVLVGTLTRKRGMSAIHAGACVPGIPDFRAFTCASIGDDAAIYRLYIMTTSSAPPVTAGAHSSWHSLGRVGDFLGDVSQPGRIAQAAAQRSFKGELILMLLNPQFADPGFNFILQMRRLLGFEHYLVIAAAKGECEALRGDWAMLRTSGSNLACGWSSETTENPAWQRWGLERTHKYVLWAARWYVASRLCDLGVNVLVTDVDGVILADPYPLLHSPPLSEYDVVVTDVGEGRGVNCGFVYLRATTTSTATSSRSRSSNPSAELQHQQQPPPQRCSPVAAYGARRAKPCRTAAAWLAAGVYERIQRLLELPQVLHRRKPGRPVRPQIGVLWEAHAWNDVLLSVQRDAEVHSWAVSKLTKPERQLLWRQLNASAGGALTRSEDSSRLLGREMSAQTFSSPAAVPKEAFADAFAQRHLRNRSLITMDLCAPARYRVATGRCLRSGRLAMAPPWLVSQGAPQALSWALATPRPVAHFHLVNMWRCAFVDYCYARGLRMWWLRANGLYDGRLPQLLRGSDGGGGGSGERPKLLMLHPDAIASLVGSGQFIRLHHAMHHLVTLASLLGRRPLVPELPCAFFRAANANWLARRRRRSESRYGLSLPDIVAVGPPSSPRCYLFPGGGTCFHTLEPFDMQAPPPPAAGAPPTIRLQDLRTHGSVEARLSALCNLSRTLAAATVVALDGIQHLRTDEVIDGVGEASPTTGAIVSALDPSSRTVAVEAALRACPADAIERYASVAGSCANYLMSNAHTVRRSRTLSRELDESTSSKYKSLR